MDKKEVKIRLFCNVTWPFLHYFTYRLVAMATSVLSNQKIIIICFLHVDKICEVSVEYPLVLDFALKSKTMRAKPPI